MHRCGRRGVLPGAFSLRPTDPAAASTSPLMAESLGTKSSATVFPSRGLAASELLWHLAEMAGEYLQSSKQQQAAYTAQTIRETPGGGYRPITASGSAAGILAASLPILATPTLSMFRIL